MPAVTYTHTHMRYLRYQYDTFVKRDLKQSRNTYKRDHPEICALPAVTAIGADGKSNPVWASIVVFVGGKYGLMCELCC